MTIEELLKSLDVELCTRIQDGTDDSVKVDEVELVGKFRIIHNGEVKYATLPVGIMQYHGTEPTLVRLAKTK